MHLAAQPGVRDSWRQAFRGYVGHNVLATQRVLDAVVRRGEQGRVRVVLLDLWRGRDAAHGGRPVPHLALQEVPSWPASLLGAYRQLGVSEPRCASSRPTARAGPTWRFGASSRRPSRASPCRCSAPAPSAATSPSWRTSSRRPCAWSRPASRARSTWAGRTIALNDLIAVIERVVGRPVRSTAAPRWPATRPAPPRPSAARLATFGYAPTVDLDEGIARAAQWLESCSRAPARRGNGATHVPRADPQTFSPPAPPRPGSRRPTTRAPSSPRPRRPAAGAGDLRPSPFAALPRPSRRCCRRENIDLTLAVIIGVLTLPLALVIALAIKLYDRGPVLFAQQRTGLGGQRFRMLKFRTMCVNAEEMKGGAAAPEPRRLPRFKRWRTTRA